MKSWLRRYRQSCRHARGRRRYPSTCQFALLLICGVRGLLGFQAQAYQAVQDKPHSDEVFTVRIADTQNTALPNVSVAFMKDGVLVVQRKTGADGRASARVPRGLIALSIRQTGYVPVVQVVDTRSTSELEVNLTPVPRPQETVNVQATNEDITEQTSSPGASPIISPMEVFQEPLKPI